MTLKDTFRAMKKAVGVVALVGILGGSTKFVLDSVYANGNDSQRERIERNKKIIQSPLEYRASKSDILKASNIEEAIAKGLRPGGILSFTDGDGRKMIIFYKGKDANGNYGLNMVGADDLTINQIEERGYRLDNFHAPESQ